MLPAPTEFPHAGSQAFLRAGSAHNPGDRPLRVRIIQPQSGCALIAIQERWGPNSSGRATTNRTVALADLFATEAEAELPVPAHRKARA